MGQYFLDTKKIKELYQKRCELLRKEIIVLGWGQNKSLITQKKMQLDATLKYLCKLKFFTLLVYTTDFIQKNGVF